MSVDHPLLVERVPAVRPTNPLRRAPRRVGLRSIASTGLALLAVAAGARAATTTTTLPAVADTTLRQQQTNQNRGTDELIRLGWAQGSRALVRFDPAAIAAAVGSGRLVSAHLELWVEATGESWGSGAQNVGAHRVLAEWTETGATWNCAIDGHPGDNRADCSPLWNGGSFLAAATATLAHTQSTHGAVRFDVTADVTAFLGGTANRGWLLKKASDSAGGRIDYAAREGASANAPRLVLVIEPATGGDATPPDVAILAPREGAFLPDATPAFRATYADAGSGIDLASVLLTIDGSDRTAELAIGPAGASFTPAVPLPEGAHSAEILVRDLAGNETRLAHAFITDSVAPSVAIIAPNAPVSPGDLTPDVEATFSDATSGIMPGSVKVTVDGTDLTPGCAVAVDSIRCQAPLLAAGLHTISATAVDRAGNPRDVAKVLEVLPDVEAPGVIIASPTPDALVNTPSLPVTGLASDASAIREVTVNGVAATVTGGSFAGVAPLVEGANAIFVNAVDASENAGSASVTVELDTVAPAIRIDAPVAGTRVNAALVRVAGTAEDAHGVTVTVDGRAVPVDALGNFSTEVVAAPGSNQVRVRAVDGAGNATEATVAYERFVLPVVAITAPAELATIGATTVTVAGTVSDPGAIVSVNGRPAVVSGGTFSAADVPLIEGGNILTAVATAPDGHQGTDSIDVVRDLTPPRIAIETPLAGANLFAPTATVTGLANDIVAGTVNESEVTVTVNGRPAQVSNRSFAAEGVSLVAGDNLLEVVATDEVGNVARATASVRYVPAGTARLIVVSGDRQEGQIGTLLPQPLVVALLDAAGAPVAGHSVLFELRGNDGALDGAKRRIAVSTDAAGRAEARFTLGRRAGVQNQRVEAEAVGFGKTMFTATALPGPPALAVVDAGDQQVGVAGQALARPLIAAVVDAGSNRLRDVPVRLRVVAGGGRFADGSTERVIASDGDGRVIVPFLLGPEEAIAGNIVEAAIDGLADGPVASFTATGWVAGDPAATTISGVVLDNENLPIEGVTARILDSPLSAHTDAKGQFRIAGAPVGTVKLIVDGSTALRPGSWPDLEFVLATVPGRDNTVNMPIFLLPLDLGTSLPVDETRGGTLRLPAVPGFALEIAPGSVTFPGGSRSGVVSVTLVHGDKVPMVPNFGQQPRLIVTIQPAGARFEPPARMTMPNVDGLAPGEVTEMYSFDHDLGHFVSIGPATVSDDGLTVVSNLGVGVVKAGWHCGGNPSSSGTAHNCPECQKCVNNRCEPNDGGGCDDHDECTVRDKCMGGSCKGEKKKIDSVEATANGSRNAETFITKEVTFDVTVQSRDCTGGDLTYKWDFGDGTATSTAKSPTHKYEKPGVWHATVEVKCKTCDTKTAVASVAVRCPQITITGTNPNISILCPGCTMQFTATVDPPEFQVKWRMAPGGDLGGQASISSSGLLTIAAGVTASGTATVRASVTDDGENCWLDRGIFVFVPPNQPRGIFGTNASERAWIAANPGCAWQNRNVQSECWQEMERNFPPNQRQDPNRGNAFLHAYCNCLVAQRCGVDVAKGLWDAHEQYDGNTCQYAGMDFNNNEVGRQVSAGGGNCTTAVLGALNAGRLRWMDPPPAPGACSQFQQTP